MSCDYPAGWPPVLHRWRRGDDEDILMVLAAFGNLRAGDPGETVEIAALIAAKEYIHSSDDSLGSNASRLALLFSAYHLVASPGETQMQTAERYLGNR